MSTQVLVSKPARRRSTIVAALLSAIAPGVGQIYAGRPVRAAIFFGALLAIQGVIAVGTLLMPPSLVPLLLFAVAAITITVGVYIFAIVDAVRLVREGSISTCSWYVLVAAVAGVYLAIEVLLMAAPVVRAYQPWHTYDVASASMEPTLRRGETFIADTAYYDSNHPNRGDVVVYRLPKDPDTVSVKRIVALAGDRIAFRDGHAFIGGTPVLEPYAKSGSLDAPFSTLAEMTVPANTVFVAGDNRDNSEDSRDLSGHGPVPIDQLLGRATEIVVSSFPDRAGRWVGTPK